MDSEHIPDYLLQENQVASEDNVGLFNAALAGSAYGVENYLKKGAKPNFFFRPEDNKNALHVASEKGYLEVVQLLLDNGAEVNSKTASDHYTALILAAQHENSAVTKLLISAGADISAENGYGNTALHEACHAGNIEVAKELVAAGANVNAVNHKGSTPIHTLCYGESPGTHTVEFLKFLLASGSNLDAADKRGMTPLLVCCTSGRVDLIEVLVEFGANPKVEDDQGRGAMAIAQFYQQEMVMKLFT